MFIVTEYAALTLSAKMLKLNLQVDELINTS